MKSFVVIHSVADTVYVSFGHEIFEQKENSGRIICAISDTVSNGMKPERIGQFNQNGELGYQIICKPQDIAYYLGFFMMKTKLQRIKYTKCCHHPLHDDLRKRALKRKERRAQ